LKINFILPLNTEKPSGGFKIAYEYADRLAERGHDVVIYYPYINEMLDILDKDKFIRYLLVCIRNKFPMVTSPSWFHFKHSVRHYVVPEISDLHVRDGDVLLATAWTTAHMIEPLSKEKGSKYYLIQHYETVMSGGFSKDLVEKSYVLGLNTIVISNWLKDMMHKINVPVAAYIPNGIDLDIFSMEKPIENRNPLTIAMMYHLAEFKGIEDGFNALNLVQSVYPNLKVNLFGAFENPGNFPDWVQYFHSPSRDELCEIYNNNAIFISPSLLEGFGLPGAEAMACGCALATTDSMGIREYAKHEQTALLSKPKSPEELAANIIRLIENNKFRIDIANVGFQFIQRFTWDGAVNKMERLFQGLDKMEDAELDLIRLLNRTAKSVVDEEFIKQFVEYEAEELINLLKQCTQDNEWKINFLNSLVVELYEIKQYDNILLLLMYAVDLDEYNENTLTNLGMFLYEFGEIKLALLYLEKIKNKDEQIFAMIAKIKENRSVETKE
jgi:glycosyltransferase involved in cell wall biosynthesis